MGAIVQATGWKPYDPNNLGHLGYGSSADVVTNVQMEEMLASGKVIRPSDGKAPERIAFIQCAGSRDQDHLPYCSGVCCLASLKQALYVHERLPEAEVTIIYRDIRVRLARINAWIQEAMPPAMRARAEGSGGFTPEDSATWHRILYEKGWVAPHWPKEVGGTGWDAARRFIASCRCSSRARRYSSRASS